MLARPKKFNFKVLAFAGCYLICFDLRDLSKPVGDGILLVRIRYLEYFTFHLYFHLHQGQMVTLYMLEAKLGSSCKPNMVERDGWLSVINGYIRG